MAEARDFKFGTQLGFARLTIKPHPEEKWVWPWVREGFPFNISETAALSSMLLLVLFILTSMSSTNFLAQKILEMNMKY